MTDSNAQKTVDALEPVAIAMANHVREFWTQLRWDPREWRNEAACVNPLGACTGEGKFTFRFPNGSHIIFSNVTIQTPIPRDAITVGDLEEAGPRVPKDAEKREFENDSDVPLKRLLGKRDTEGSKEGTASSIGTTIGASMAAKMRQQFGYGDAAVHGVEGETEIELAVSTSVEHAVNNSSFAEQWREHEKTEELEVEYQPHTGYRLERVAYVCPARQVTTLRGALTYGVQLEFHGVEWFGWTSLRQMHATMKGISLDDEPFRKIDAYRHFPIRNPEKHPLGQTVHSVIQEVLEFEHSNNVQGKVSDWPLDPKRRLNDAMKLIADQSDDEDLKALVKAALEQG